MVRNKVKQALREVRFAKKRLQGEKSVEKSTYIPLVAVLSFPYVGALNPIWGVNRGVTERENIVRA